MHVEPVPLLCTISGKQAKYVDPDTGAPYANVEAYRVLRKGWGLRDLNHERLESFFWDSSLKAFSANVIEDPERLSDFKDSNFQCFFAS